MAERSNLRRLVFDADAWKGKDVGDNSQFWKPATILSGTRRYLDSVATVRFDDGHISHGHFTCCMRPIIKPQLRFRNYQNKRLGAEYNWWVVIDRRGWEHLFHSWGHALYFISQHRSWL